MDAQELAAKEARLVELEAQFNALRGEIGKLNQEITEAKARFKIGDIVRWKNGAHERRGRIEELRPCTYANGAYTIRTIRKDGSDGQTVTVMDWKFSKLQLDEAPVPEAA